MRRQTFAALALLPALTLGLAACGDGGGGAGGKATAKAASDADKMRAFAKCMRENGVNMSDPQIDKDGGIKTEVKEPNGGSGKVLSGGGGGMGPDGEGSKAMQKCRHLQPNGGKPRKPKPEELAQMRAHAKCMREHGVNMPDPSADGMVTMKMEKGQEGTAADPNSQKFKDADKACAKLRPKPPKGEGPSNSQGG